MTVTSSTVTSGSSYLARQNRTSRVRSSSSSMAGAERSGRRGGPPRSGARPPDRVRAVSDDGTSSTDVVSDLHERSDRVRAAMGGADKVARLDADGDKTIRQHIDGLLDPGS